ncbi:MAG TPA: hypothetical protein VHF90_05090 [Thermoleophilaceae bacterium]|nr:hypothetical protein [Thermoleophilaceae bacterium]
MIAKKRTASFVVATLLAVAAASCGSGDDGPHRDATRTPGETASAATASADRVRAIYDDFIDDIYRGRFRAACGSLTDRARAAIPGTKSCQSRLEALFGPMPRDAPRPKLRALELSGDTGKAQAVTSGQPKAQIVHFVEHDGRWRIDAQTAMP